MKVRRSSYEQKTEKESCPGILVLDALKGEQKLVEIAQRYQIHPNQIAPLSNGWLRFVHISRYYYEGHETGVSRW